MPNPLSIVLLTSITISFKNKICRSHLSFVKIKMHTKKHLYGFIFNTRSEKVNHFLKNRYYIFALKTLPHLLHRNFCFPLGFTENGDRGCRGFKFKLTFVLLPTNDTSLLLQKNLGHFIFATTFHRPSEKHMTL